MHKVFKPSSVEDSFPPPDDLPGMVLTPSGLYVPVGATWQGIITFDGNGVVLNNATLSGSTILDDVTFTGNTVLEDLRLSDTVWDDLRFPAVDINPPGAASDPTRNNANGLLEFHKNETNVVAIQVQMPHDWKLGSPISPHVHWRKKVAGAGAVVWQLQYEFVAVGGVFTDTYTTLSSSTLLPTGMDNDVALRHLLTPLGTITIAATTTSVMGILLLSRLGGDGADTYDDWAQLLEFDIHYQRDSLGSRSLYNKDSNTEPT